MIQATTSLTRTASQGVTKDQLNPITMGILILEAPQDLSFAGN